MHGVAVAKGLTVEDVWAIPDDGQRRELIEGELFVSPSPDREHQRIVLNVAQLLDALQTGRRVLTAPLDVVAGPNVLVQPDVLAYGIADSATLEPRGDLRDGPVPELVVEVSSPSTWRLDVIRKRRIYERIGVAEYWFVDREARVIDVYAFGAQDDLRTATEEEQVPSALLGPGIGVADVLRW